MQQQQQQQQLVQQQQQQRQTLIQPPIIQQQQQQQQQQVMQPFYTQQQQQQQQQQFQGDGYYTNDQQMGTNMYNYSQYPQQQQQQQQQIQRDNNYGKNGSYSYGQYGQQQQQMQTNTGFMQQGYATQANAQEQQQQLQLQKEAEQKEEQRQLQINFFDDITTNDVNGNNDTKPPKRGHDHDKNGADGFMPFKRRPFYLEQDYASRFLTHEEAIEFSSKEFPDMSELCGQSVPSFAQAVLTKLQERLSPFSVDQPQCTVPLPCQCGDSDVAASYPQGLYATPTASGTLDYGCTAETSSQHQALFPGIEGVPVAAAATAFVGGDSACRVPQYGCTETGNDAIMSGGGGGGGAAAAATAVTTSISSEPYWAAASDTDSTDSEDDDYGCDEYEYDDEECATELNEAKPRQKNGSPRWGGGRRGSSSNNNSNSNNGGGGGNLPFPASTQGQSFQFGVGQQQQQQQQRPQERPALRVTEEMRLSLQESEGSSARFAELLSTGTVSVGGSKSPSCLSEKRFSNHAYANIKLLFQDMAFSGIENPIFDHMSARMWQSTAFGAKPGGAALLSEETTLSATSVAAARLALTEDTSASPALQGLLEPLTEEASPEVCTAALEALGRALGGALGGRRGTSLPRLRTGDIAGEVADAGQRAAGAGRAVRAYQLATPVLVAGTKGKWMECPPRWIGLWDRMHIYPYSLQKDIRYYVLYPEGKRPYVDVFFRNLAVTYENCNLGSHTLGAEYVSVPRVSGSAATGIECNSSNNNSNNEEEDGGREKKKEVEEDEEAVRQYMGKAQALGAEIRESFKKYDDTSVVVYFVDPFSSRRNSSARVASGFQSIAQCMVALRQKVVAAPVVTEQVPMELVLEGPCDSTLLRELSFSVFNKVKRIEAEYDHQTYLGSKSSAPPHPIYEPYTILSPLNPVRDMDHVHCTKKVAHVACMLSDDGCWVVSVMADAYGEMLETFIVPIERPSSSSSSTLSTSTSTSTTPASTSTSTTPTNDASISGGLENALNEAVEGWYSRLASTCHKGWDIVVTRYGVLTAGEAAAWSKALKQASAGKLHETVDFACLCSLRLLPDFQADIDPRLFQQKSFGDAASFVVPLAAPMRSEADCWDAANATAQVVVVSPAPDVFFAARRPVAYSVLTHATVDVAGNTGGRWDNHLRLCTCVAKRFNALSWLNISPASPLRKSVLPFHVVIVRRLAQISTFLMPVYKSVMSLEKGGGGSGR